MISADPARAFGAEESRIRRAYERRHTNVPQDRYSRFNPGNLLSLHDVEQHMLKLLRRHGREALSDQRVLDVGCGDGYWLRQFIQWGARPENLFGVDLLEERIAQARYLTPDAVNLECGNAADLKFNDGTFDIVCQFIVFTSVLDEHLKQRMAFEMLRVLKPNGAILWYDFHFDNPRNPDVKGVKKSEIRRLFPNCRVDIARVTLAPQIGRRLGWISPLACQSLSALKMLCTHYVALLRRS